MSAILIRGLSPSIRSRIQRLASDENLSINQAVIQLLKSALTQLEKNWEENRERKDVFDRIEKLRAELHEKYGKFDDSTKLIREDRDSH